MSRHRIKDLIERGTGHYDEGWGVL
jgi:hypothetical protein